MTQVNPAQSSPGQVALRRRADVRTLAQRRADFAAQMRDMALSDLSQLSTRLKELHEELEKLEARKWTHYELAAAMKIAPRTFQAWENGENENRDGKGYDKMARFYSRKLGRKITRQWILFGDSQDEPAREPIEEEPEREVLSASRLNEVLAELAQVKLVLAEQQLLLETVIRNQEAGS